MFVVDKGETIGFFQVKQKSLKMEAVVDSVVSILSTTLSTSDGTYSVQTDTLRLQLNKDTPDNFANKTYEFDHILSTHNSTKQPLTFVIPDIGADEVLTNTTSNDSIITQVSGFICNHHNSSEWFYL